MFQLFAPRRDSANTTTTTSIVPKSPTKSGVMRDDKHWVLTTPRCPGFEHPYKSHAWCHAVASIEVKFEMFQRAAAMAKLVNDHEFQDRWVGRRVNDEVELFLEEWDEEYELLKKCLEEHRFTVRPFVQMATKPKRPHVTYETAQGGGENKLMNAIMKSLKKYIQEELVYEEGVEIEYGFIIDFPAPKKSLCIGRVDRETFKEKKDQEGATIEAGNDHAQFDGTKEQWKILGHIRNGKPKLWCDEDVTKQYFDSIGRINEINCVDYIEEKVQAEKKAKKKEKKAAKKHRRKITESTTVTTPSSEMSFGSRFTEEDEAVKARQRAKQNEKRKRHQQRRKGEAEKEVEKPFIITMIANSDSDESKTSSTSSNWETLHKFQDAVFQQHSKKDKLRALTFQRKPKVEACDDSDEDDKKIRVNLPKVEQTQQPRKDSVKEVEEEDRGIEIVHVSTAEETRPYLQRGGQVWVTSKEDIQESNGELKARDLKYLGRGL